MTWSLFYYCEVSPSGRVTRLGEAGWTNGARGRRRAPLRIPFAKQIVEAVVEQGASHLQQSVSASADQRIGCRSPCMHLPDGSWSTGGMTEVLFTLLHFAVRTPSCVAPVASEP